MDEMGWKKRLLLGLAYCIVLQLLINLTYSSYLKFILPSTYQDQDIDVFTGMIFTNIGLQVLLFIYVCAGYLSSNYSLGEADDFVWKWWLAFLLWDYAMLLLFVLLKLHLGKENDYLRLVPVSEFEDLTPLVFMVAVKFYIPKIYYRIRLGKPEKQID